MTYNKLPPQWQPLFPERHCTPERAEAYRQQRAEWLASHPPQTPLGDPPYFNSPYNDLRYAGMWM